MPSKKRAEKEKRNSLKQASANCKSLKDIFQAHVQTNEEEHKEIAVQESRMNKPGESSHLCETNDNENTPPASTKSQLILEEKETQFSITKNQPKNITFPKTLFGNKERSFNTSWYFKFPWIHYDVTSDAVFCFTCMKAHKKGYKTLSANVDPAFLTRGFRNWKKAGERFLEHENSVCHKEFNSLLEFQETNIDIEEQLSEQKLAEKAVNRQMFLTILRNIQFLGRQGLAFRGNSDEGNFDQLLKLSAKVDPRLSKWLERKRNKYVHGDCQNEIIKVISFILLRDIAKNINDSPFYSIMADEVTDSSNTEQLVVCFRWVDSELQAHEDFIGIHSIENIKSDTIVCVIKDILTRFNIPPSNCRGQCYDGASNMTGLKKGVATQILSESPLAFLTHCYGHALNLAVGDMIKAESLFRNTMDTTSELSKLIKKSPKRDTMLSKIKEELSLEYHGFRVLCPTRWTVRAACLKSILDNWDAINLLWNASLEERLDPEIRGRIIGVQSQMHSFDYFFGVYVLQLLLRHSDNLSKSLQNPNLTASDGQALAHLSINTLNKLRSDDAFDSFWQNLQRDANSLGLPEPVMPRKRKKPERYMNETESACYNDISEVQLLYKRIYINALDTITSCIKDRFDQPGYKACRNIETLIINAANGNIDKELTKEVLETYSCDIIEIELLAQLKSLEVQFDKQTVTNITDVIVKMKSLSKPMLVYYSQIVTLLKILLVMPATNAVSERSASCLRRIKQWLRTSMTQQRLNHCMLLTVHKERTDNVNLIDVANEFCSSNDERFSTFGHFSERDLSFKVFTV